MLMVSMLARDQSSRPATPTVEDLGMELLEDAGGSHSSNWRRAVESEPPPSSSHFLGER
jgi:hypothetical protein